MQMLVNSHVRLRDSPPLPSPPLFPRSVSYEALRGEASAEKRSTPRVFKYAVFVGVFGHRLVISSRARFV